MSESLALRSSLEIEAKVRLRAGVVEDRAGALGARTDVDRARIMGIGRETLRRWREGTPQMPGKARRAASRLGVTVDELFEEAA